MKSYKYMVHIYICTISMLFLLACTNSQKTHTTRTNSSANNTTSSHSYRIVNTVSMVGDTVKNIVGDKAEIITLLGEGIDPHLYRPTRNDIITLQHADIVFYVGLRLEAIMEDTLEAMSKTQNIIKLGPSIPIEHLLPYGGTNSAVLIDSQSHDIIADPHVWMNPLLWSFIAHRITQTLAEYDPHNAAFFHKNNIKFQTKLKNLYDYAHNAIQTIPQQSRILITSHDAFNYLGTAFGIEVIGIQGISTEMEASLAHINNLVNLIITHKIPAIFVESSASEKSINAIIEGTASHNYTLQKGPVLYADSMGTAGTYEGTYMGMIAHNIYSITTTLGGTAQRFSDA